MIERKNKVVDILGKGIVLVFTDIHGNYSDYKITKEIFEKTAKEENKDVYVVYAGDYVHPFPFPGHQFYYEDQSDEVLDDLIENKNKKRICLIGNHDYTHIGAGSVYKGGVNQTNEFEYKYEEKLPKYKEFLKTLPLVARTQNGIIISHSGPIISKFKLEDVRDVDYEDFGQDSILDQLLWTRDYAQHYMGDFLKGISDEKIKAKILVTGHTPIQEGYKKVNQNQIIISSSFCTYDECKTYLKIDLEREYISVNDFKEGRELLKLIH